MNSVVVTLVVIFCLLALIENPYLLSCVYVSSGSLLIFKSIILIISIYEFKAFVDTIDFAMPNKCLMRLHITNVIVYTILLIGPAVLHILTKHVSHDSETKAKYWCAFSFAITFQGIFALYNVAFIFILLWKQTKKRD